MSAYIYKRSFERQAAVGERAREERSMGEGGGGRKGREGREELHLIGLWI